MAIHLCLDPEGRNGEREAGRSSPCRPGGLCPVAGTGQRSPGPFQNPDGQGRDGPPSGRGAGASGCRRGGAQGHGGRSRSGCSRIPRPGDLQVLADSNRLSLVLSNLVVNAIRHTPAGGNVQLRSPVTEGNVRFEVSDTGEGVPSDCRERIFEKFFQVPGPRPGDPGWDSRSPARSCSPTAARSGWKVKSGRAVRSGSRCPWPRPDLTGCTSSASARESTSRCPRSGRRPRGWHSAG